MSEDSARVSVTEVVAGIGRWWWLWLVFGVAWLIAAMVVLELSPRSVTFVGVLAGVMFLVAAAQAFVMGALIESGWRWLWFVFGALLAVAGMYSLVHPGNTVSAFADSLGFIFLLVGVMWLIDAFASRESDPLWWLLLISAILMLLLAFWASGQFFGVKLNTLLIFVGIFALMKGITDIFKAFAIRSVGREAQRQLRG